MRIVNQEAKMEEQVNILAYRFMLQDELEELEKFSYQMDQTAILTDNPLMGEFYRMEAKKAQAKIAAIMRRLERLD